MSSNEFDIEYDEEAASHADDIANRIDQSSAYIGTFTKAEVIRTQKDGYGVHLEFEALGGGGTTNFNIYTKDKDKKPFFGNNQLQAIQNLMGLRGLTAQEGKVGDWSDDGKRIEVDGHVYPELLGKKIGLVLQKEKYTKQDKTDGFRMNLFGAFHPETRFTASEIKERKAAPEKLEKMLRSLKDKDSRVVSQAEPAQPPMGAQAGGY